MTLNTNRNDINPMLRLVVPVVILLALLAAFGTFLSAGRGYFACGNGIIDHITSLSLMGIDGVILAGIGFALVGLVVFAGCGFSLVGLIVCSVARLAMRMQAVFATTALVKLRNWKNSFAFRTSLCWNGLIHNLSFVKVMFRGRLPYRAVGSLYYMRAKFRCQQTKCTRMYLGS